MERINKQHLIADFVQLPESKGVAKPGIRVFEFNGQLFDELKFNSSYDWFMPAWVKFRDLKLEGQKKSMHQELRMLIAHEICFAGIQEAFERLVSGIEWYNLNR